MQKQPEAPRMKNEQRFSDRVENYIRYRPGYPREVLVPLVDSAGLGAESVVADLGSGTGIFSALLLTTGCTVIGVEPNSPMREAAERLLATSPRFRSVEGNAAATTLADGSVDLVTAAQAFHWFNAGETRAEADRILKTGGMVALVWNERKTDSSPFLRDYESLLMQFGTDYAAVRHENVDGEALKTFFRDGYRSYVSRNLQSFAFEGLKGRLLSCSYAPNEGHSDHEAMLTELRSIFHRHAEAGQVTFEYDTRLHLGP